jgi:hypothetical protein
MATSQEIHKSDIIDKVISNDGVCVSCGELLRADSLDLYNHDGGVKIVGYTEKQWVSFECHCGYGSALWKVLREIENRA